MSVRRRPSPVYGRSRLVAAILALASVAVGFFTLMVRLEVVEEGYRLSEVRAEIAKLEEENRALNLAAAQLGTPERLRALARKYGLRPPSSAQVVTMP
jgi:cell division protein FtsL